MQELGNITIDVYQDEKKHYLFDVVEQNDNVCVKYVVEDALKIYQD